MDDAAEILRNDGARLATIEDKGFKVSLYSIDGEFYEIYHNAVDNRIIKVVQASRNALEKYPKKIKAKTPIH
jgi:hypothetical protein